MTQINTAPATNGRPTGGPGPSRLRAAFIDGQLITRFPHPRQRVVTALAKLRAAANSSNKAQIARAKHMPRPWIPASCPPQLRREVLGWLEQVAAWHNREYGWMVGQSIPTCWDRHPHIIQELAVLAFLRLDAERANDPKDLEEWHRHTRPLFIERILKQIGEGCGKDHNPWPDRSRWFTHTSDEEHQRRTARFDTDLEATAGSVSGPDADDDVPPWINPVTGAIDEEAYRTALAAGEQMARDAEQAAAAPPRSDANEAPALDLSHLQDPGDPDDGPPEDLGPDPDYNR